MIAACHSHGYFQEKPTMALIHPTQCPSVLLQRLDCRDGIVPRQNAIRAKDGAILSRCTVNRDWPSRRKGVPRDKGHTGQTSSLRAALYIWTRLVCPKQRDHNDDAVRRLVREKRRVRESRNGSFRPAFPSRVPDAYDRCGSSGCIRTAASSDAVRSPQ